MFIKLSLCELKADGTGELKCKNSGELNIKNEFNVHYPLYTDLFEDVLVSP